LPTSLDAPEPTPFSAADSAPLLAHDPAAFRAPPQPSAPPPPRPSAPPPPFSARPPKVTALEASAKGAEDPDHGHFSQVFEEYLALRQRCGESVVGLSLEKFAAKLQSNRDQLISKHGCRTANFTVYEKDGKAAIRAVPVRE
jgi:hypothetical protein